MVVDVTPAVVKQGRGGETAAAAADANAAPELTVRTTPDETEESAAGETVVVIVVETETKVDTTSVGAETSIGA